MSSLKEKRLEAGITCEKMATMLGMTKSNYSKKENGYITVSVNEAIKLAKILNTNVEELFSAEQVD